MGDVSSVPLVSLVVRERKRSYVPGNVAALADSIREGGLLNPITVRPVGDEFELVTGFHRLEAARRLGWQSIPALVQDMDDLAAELAEIDENLVRSELSYLERCEHLARRDEILKLKGERAERGQNRFTQRDRRANLARLPTTTAELGEESGMSARAVQRSLQIVRGISPKVRDLIRSTPLARNGSELDALARIDDPVHQLAIAQAVIGGRIPGGVRFAVGFGYQKCGDCEAMIPRDSWHCQRCGAHSLTRDSFCRACRPLVAPTSPRDQPRVTTTPPIRFLSTPVPRVVPTPSLWQRPPRDAQARQRARARPTQDHGVKFEHYWTSFESLATLSLGQSPAAVAETLRGEELLRKRELIAAWRDWLGRLEREIDQGQLPTRDDIDSPH